MAKVHFHPRQDLFTLGELGNQEALHPESCCECGHCPDQAHHGISVGQCLDQVNAALKKLPDGPFKERLGQLSGDSDVIETTMVDGVYVVPAGTLDGIEEIPPGEVVAGDQAKTATWLAEHCKLLGAWVDVLLECCAEAYALLEETNPNDLEDCRLIAAAKEALLHGLESR